MGTTPLGLAYPDDTDYVIDGAAAIQALAESLDTALEGLMRLRGGTTLDSVVLPTGGYAAVGTAGSFTAPASGKVVVSLAAYFSASSGVGQAFLSFALAGPTTVAADDARGVKGHIDATSTPIASPQVSGEVYVEGLTPGGAYTITLHAYANVAAAAQGLSAVVKG